MIGALNPAPSKALVAPNAEEPRGPHLGSQEMFPALTGSHIKLWVTMAFPCHLWLLGDSGPSGHRSEGDAGSHMAGGPTSGTAPAATGSTAFHVGEMPQRLTGDGSHCCCSQRLQRGAKLGLRFWAVLQPHGEAQALLG